MNVVVKEIKKSLFCKGDETVRINISYHTVKDKKHYARAMNKFYKSIAENFLKFAENKLAAFARKHMSDAVFEPAAAVMKARVAYEDTRFVSVCTEISVYDGLGNIKRIRKQHTWDKNLAVITPGRMLPENVLSAK